GAVDQDVDRRVDLRDGRLNRCGIGDIAAEEFRSVGRRARQVERYHAHAGCQQRLDCRSTKPGIAAGNDRGLACRTHSLSRPRVRATLTVVTFQVAPPSVKQGRGSWRKGKSSTRLSTAS